MNAVLPQRLTVFAPDIPFPPTRGGRADVWRRLQALQRLGVHVQLVCFYDDHAAGRPRAEHRAEVLRATSSLHVYPIAKGLWPTVTRLARIARAPWHVVCRTLRGAPLQALLDEIRAFDPDLIWSEGPWCGGNALAAAESLDVPLIYRSHNVEHVYMRRQARAARRPRDRLAWTIACFGLRRFELDLLRRAGWIFDISADDVAAWQANGIRNISWLPPLAEAALTGGTAAPRAGEDVVFLGNLTTPNNIRGVEWLVRDIRPLVLAQRPGTRFLVAGSNPGPHVHGLCRATGVTLLADPPDAGAVYAAARVLVNPVRTGGGTQVKAIEMLMTQAPVVSARQGTQGLPPEVKRLFRVADDAAGFARQIVEAIESGPVRSPERDKARELFGIAGLERALRALPRDLTRRPGGRA